MSEKLERALDELRGLEGAIKQCEDWAAAEERALTRLQDEGHPLKAHQLILAGHKAALANWTERRDRLLLRIAVMRAGRG